MVLLQDWNIMEKMLLMPFPKDHDGSQFFKANSSPFIWFEEEIAYNCDWMWIEKECERERASENGLCVWVFDNWLT